MINKQNLLDQKVMKYKKIKQIINKFRIRKTRNYINFNKNKNNQSRL